MSNPDTPVTPAGSQSENQPRPQSTQPSSTSSPMTDADQGMEDAKKYIANGAEDTTEDVEEIDTKAKALMHLLNTSEVFLPALS